MHWKPQRDVSFALLCIWTITFFNVILVVILLFYRIDDCTASAFKTKYGVQFYDHSVKACAVLEIVDECIQSINGNCATDEFFSSDLFIIQQECAKEKFGCSENQKET